MSLEDSAIAARRVALPAAHRRPGAAQAWGLLGVLAFSVSLPATRAAVPAFGPVTVGAGRAVLAAVLAGTALRLARAPLPSPAQVRRLGLVVVGVVLGFPLLSSAALQEVGAAHGAVIVGLLPIGTAVAALLRAGERPRPAFWVAGAAGALAVLVFARTAAAPGAGQFGIRPADLLLLGAVLAGALGYAEGGALARELPGWQVIGWALVLAAPLTVPLSVVAVTVRPPVAPDAGAWAGLAYVAAISMFGGFVAWYRGLALGGVARVGQLQLVQPVLTLAWSAALLAERVDAATVLAALAVLGCTAATQWVRAEQRVRAEPRVRGSSG
jgi:drug/metabolite transporter (DMT)-like permease